MSQERLCDTSFEDCRAPLLELVRAERKGLDVGLYYMNDTALAQAVIGRFKAGVPVRVLFDLTASSKNSNPAAMANVTAFKTAGIPMRAKATGNLHWKTIIFAGQGKVQFSSANFGESYFSPVAPYTNYIDEVIYLTDDPAVVNSFKTKFDSHWVNATLFTNYANVSGPLARLYPTSPIDPEVNFNPGQKYNGRLLPLLDAETQALDVIMFRITDPAVTDKAIAAHGRGVPVRLITEPDEYRNENKLYHSYNVDRMYAAGITVRHRAHAGQTHEKAVILRSQARAVFGSANWTDSKMEEHNYFTRKAWVFEWFVSHFERKWNNDNPLGVVEYKPFTPRPPGAPVNLSPADGSIIQTTAVTLKWEGGAFAHKFDVLLGTSPTNLQPVVAEAIYPGAIRQHFAPDSPELAGGAPDCVSQVVDEDTSAVECVPTAPETYTLTGLNVGVTYYWQVVGKTMAGKASKGPVWSFSTGAPTLPGDVVPPEVEAPARRLVANSMAGSSAVPVRLTWGASDPGGISLYELQQSTDGGAFSPVSLPSATAVSLTRSLAAGKTYQFRVRARDKAGNWSDYAAGEGFSVLVLQETHASVSYSGTWAREAMSGAMGGYVKYSSAAGAAATVGFTGGDVGWVAPRGEARGKAEVYLDGRLVATIDLYASSTQARRVAFAGAVSRGAHTLRVRVLGQKRAAATGKRVDVDSFVVLQ